MVGALDKDGLWVEGGRRRHLMIGNWAMRSTDLFAGMDYHGIHILHIHRNALELLGLPSRLEPPMPGTGRPAHPFVDDCVWRGKRVSQRALSPSTECAGMEIMIGAYQDGRGDPFEGAHDARELLAAHLAFAQAFEIGGQGRWEYRQSANSTGWKLLHAAWRHGRRRSLLGDFSENEMPRLEGVGWTKADDDDPPSGHPQVEQVYGSRWARDPSLVDADGCLANVLAWDVNGQRLSACANLQCGIGGLTHHTGDVPWRETIKLPGYHLVTGIEHTFAGLIPPLMEPGWHTSPMLMMATYLGIQVEVKQSWVWKRHVPYLHPFYEQLRDARRLLLQAVKHGVLGADLALDALKQVSLQPLGRLRSYRTSQHDPSHYRPHWYDSVIGNEVAREYLRLHQLAQARVPVLAVYFDTILIETDSEDLLNGAPAAIEVSDQLGKYKPVGKLNSRRAHRALYAQETTLEEDAPGRQILAAPRSVRPYDVGNLVKAIKAASS